MAPNEYVQFLNKHRIENGLLREFLHKRKWKPAKDELVAFIEREKIKMEMMTVLVDILERLEEE